MKKPSSVHQNNGLCEEYKKTHILPPKAQNCFSFHTVSLSATFSDNMVIYNQCLCRDIVTNRSAQVLLTLYVLPRNETLTR